MRTHVEVLSLRHLFLGAAVALLLACQQSPTLSPATALSGLSAGQLKAQADELAARGDYEGARAKYQAAVNHEPNDVSLRFAHGVALSRLNRREETVEQFRWVVARGTADSPEVQAARNWLVNAGELSPAVKSTSSESEQPELARPPSALGSKGTVKGRLEWPPVNPREQLVPVDISIVGDDDSNRDVKLSGRFRLGRHYGFRNLPPGHYRLTAEASEPRLLLWDQKLTVEGGKDTVLDLTNANSPIRLDQFLLPPPVSRD